MKAEAARDGTERRRIEQAVRHTDGELADFFENAAVALHWVGSDGTILRANRAELAMLGYAREEYVGRNIAEFHADREVVEDILRRLAAGEELRDYRARLLCKDGSIKPVAIDSNVRFTDGRATHTRCFTRDLTAHSRAEEALRERETWLAGQSEALEAALNGAPLETSLGALVRTATVLLGGGARGGFYLANPGGATLRHVVGMGEAYTAAVADFPIGPHSLACGLAIHTGQPIYTADVNEEPRWAQALELAQKFDYRACWSIPFHTEAGKYSGTFAAYWRKPHAPTPREMEIVARVAQAAGMIVSRHMEMEVRRQAEEALRERETWLAGQSQALEAALNGAPLETSLGVLVRAATILLGGGARGGFYLANPGGATLRHVVGMGEAYTAAVADFPIGPHSLACGLAIHTGQPIYTADVNEEPRWAQALELAQKFDYRACWSIPFHTEAGKYSGTFAAYWREPHAPTPREVEIVSRVAQAAGIIVSRHMEMEVRRQAEEALRESEARLQAELGDTRLLQSISAEMIKEEDVDALYQKIVEAASAIMRSDFGSMQMLFPERGSGGELLLLGAKGFSAEAVRFWKWVRTDSNCTCGIALRTQERVIEPDVANSKIMAGTKDQAALLEAGILAAQSTPLFSRAGRILGMITTHWREPHQPGERDLRLLDVLARQAADLIERRQAEDARRKQAERMRLLWEAAATLLSADDPDVMLRGLFAKIGPHLGVDVYFNYLVNPAGDALRLASCAGVSPAIAQDIARLEFGQAICGAVARERRPIVATHIQESDDAKAQLVKSMGIRAYACNPLLAEGRLLGTLSFASRHRDAFDADEVAFLSTVCHYVTVAYERLRLLNELKDVDRRKDEFLATLAHELRNPLAPIRNAAQVLRLKGAHEPDLRWSCDVLQRQVDHLGRLIDDLLDIARITSNKLELRRQRIELAEVIHGAVQSSRPLIADRGHELTLALPREPIHLDVDAVRLSQVFLNLINNAAKYTEPGGRIRIAAERQGSEALVTVQDSGVGIPADKLPRLFEMFFQADRSLEKAHGGLGIGLALVRQLVQLHGGRVEARSDGPGKGSEFIVRLPVAAEARNAPNAQAPQPEAAFQAAPARRILIVDDNRDAADSLALLLRLAGNEVQTAYDGAEGVAAAERLRPEVVLLDLGMPRLNGYDACRHIRAQPWCNGMVLIALTGWGQEHDRQRSTEAGFDAHLVKPVDPMALLHVISLRAQAPHAPARL